jgi:hypothetical protein
MSKEPQRLKTPASTALLSTIFHHPRLGLWIGGLYGAILLSAALAYHTVGDYGIETDFFWTFVPGAEAILRGSILIEEFRGPAYPALLAGASFVFGDLFQTGVILAVVAGASVLVIVHRLFRKLLSPDAAFWGTVLIAVNPVFVQYSYSAGTDMMFFALVAGSALLLFGTTRSTHYLIISAVLAGAAYLTRYNGIFAVFAVPLVLLVGNPDREPLKTRGWKAAGYVAVFFLTILPWGLYCLSEKGSFFYNKNYLNIAYEMFAKGRVGWDEYWSQAAEQYTSLGQVILADAGLFLKTVSINTVDHFVNDMSVLLGWHTGVFAVGGMLLLYKERVTRTVAGFLLYSLVFFGLLLIVFYSERFSLFLLTAYVLLTMHLLSSKAIHNLSLRTRAPVRVLLLLVITIWTFAQSYEFNRRNIDSGPKEVLVIADWFKRNVPHAREDIVITRKPHPAYYLGLEMKGFPYVETMDDLLREAHRLNARFLYFGLIEAAMRPQFQFLLDPRLAPPQLRPIVYTTSPPAVLYEIDNSPLPR